MRGALGRVADAVEAKLAGVHAEYERRLAEQEAEGAVVLPGKEVGPQWLADKCRAGTKAQVRGTRIALCMQLRLWVCSAVCLACVRTGMCVCAHGDVRLRAWVPSCVCAAYLCGSRVLGCIVYSVKVTPEVRVSAAGL